MDWIVILEGCCVVIGCGYLDQVCGWFNLIIVIYVLSDCILFSGKCVIGVFYLVGNGDNLVIVYVCCEVLVCSGVIVLL